MTSSADGQDRLQEIWDSWGLMRDEAMSKAQFSALDAVAQWLKEGQTDPEVMIRAVQLLLADPERTDMRQRACWTTLRRAAQKEWTNASANLKDHVRFAQALVLSAWPSTEDGWLLRASLFNSAWELRRGHEPTELARWRMRLLGAGESEPESSDVTGQPPQTFKLPKVSPFTGITLDASSQLNHFAQHRNNQIESSRIHIFDLLKAHNDSINHLSAALVDTSNSAAEICQKSQGPLATIKKRLDELSAELRQEMDAVRESTDSKLNLLWWGQSRYCRALRKPYLRMKSDRAALLWWTAREAAELSLAVDVEPAAAYLVETLHNLDQPIDEKKSVLEWMKELDVTLKQAGDKVRPLSGRLDKIAKEDALGLPVTWVRRRRMLKDDFDVESAKNDVALNLDEEIDRGDWASWVFRETLLDLHLREENQ